jgi:hypothetical protein
VAWCTQVTRGGRQGVGRSGAVSTGVGGHGRTVPGPSSGNGHWADRWAKLGQTRLQLDGLVSR